MQMQQMQMQQMQQQPMQQQPMQQQMQMQQQMPMQQQMQMPQQAPSLMEIQSQLQQQQPPKANTYSAVKNMVSQMESQIQGENADEDKHRAWCDAELSKNVAVADDKEAKLQRLS